MTLRDAIKTRKPFKRPTWRFGPGGQEPWVMYEIVTNKIRFQTHPYNDWTPKVSDLEADDYEIKPEDSFEKIGRELAGAVTLNEMLKLFGRAQKLLQSELPF